MKDALVLAQWSKRGQGWSFLVFTCPYCKQPHYHGGGDNFNYPNYGHTISHCLKKSIDDDGYVLKKCIEIMYRDVRGSDLDILQERINIFEGLLTVLSSKINAYGIWAKVLSEAKTAAISDVSTVSLRHAGDALWEESLLVLLEFTGCVNLGDKFKVARKARKELFGNKRWL